MGAQVVDASLKATRWVSEKPKDYASKALEEALKALEKIDLNNVPLPGDAITVPKVSLSEIEDRITHLKAALKVLEPSLATLKKAQAAASGVCNAASKTNDELQKVIKDKKTSEDQKKKYQAASEAALAIASKATNLLSKIK